MKSESILALGLVLMSMPVLATTYYKTGAIKDIGVNDHVIYGADSNGFSISGFTTAGSCATNDGLVWMMLRDDIGGDRQLAILLAAKIGGQQVSIRVDDAVKNASGACYLQVLNLDLN